MKILITFLMSCFLLTSIAEASDIKSVDQKTEKIDAIFSGMVRPNSPGAAVAITLDGEVIYQKGYGLANLEYGIPVTPDTRFDILSVSKQFTGMAIAMLEEKKQISLEDDIRKYIPEVPDFGETITLNHLVHHTSGMRSDLALFLAGWCFEDVFSSEHILRMVQYQENLNFNPGEEYSYSNTGYNLLAETVKRVTGRSFREWTQENIFKPLNMTNTHYTYQSYSSDELASSNEWIPDDRNVDNFPTDENNMLHIPHFNLDELGAGALRSTTNDLSQLLNFVHSTLSTSLLLSVSISTNHPLT